MPHAPPAQTQRVALADHLVWMMQFLHIHHSGEDRGLWPLVRELNPAAGPLLDAMDADHSGSPPRSSGSPPRQPIIARIRLPENSFHVLSMISNRFCCRI